MKYSWNPEGIRIIFYWCEIPQVDIGIGNETNKQDDRIHDKACAVRHPGEKRNQKEPE
jgi:hypothetical protein